MSSISDAASRKAVQMAVKELRHDKVLLVERHFVGSESTFNIPPEEFASQPTKGPVVLRLHSPKERLRRLAETPGKNWEIKDFLRRVKVVFVALKAFDRNLAETLAIYLDVPQSLSDVRAADQLLPLDFLKLDCQDVFPAIVDLQSDRVTEEGYRLVEVSMSSTSSILDYHKLNFRRPS